MGNDHEAARQASRRRLLQALSLAVSGSAAACQRRDDDGGVTMETLRGAAEVLDGDRNDERLEAIRPAVAQQLDRVRALRAFELDEKVEPATLFVVKR